MAGEATATAGQTTHQAETDGIDLLPDETVLENVHPGWSVWWKHLAFAGFLLLAGLGSGSGEGIFWGLALGGGLAGYVVAARQRSRYIVTNERVKAKVGLLSSWSREYRIADVNSITTDQSLFERVLGHGHVTLRTASNDEMELYGVPEYDQVAHSIRKRQRAQE